MLHYRASLNLYVQVFCVFFLILMAFASKGKASSATVRRVKVYANPKGQVLSSAYKVNVSGYIVPVYPVRVGAADDVRRFKAVDDLMHSAEYYDDAAFCYFDMAGSATITVSVDAMVRSVKILPSSAKIKAGINKRSVSFKVSAPQNLTVEINGETIKSLHVFVNTIEAVIPKPTDPNVIYFGPGVHEVSNLVVGGNKTVYIAGGAIIKTVVGKNEQYGSEPSGLRNYPPSFILVGKNIKFCGRGILDASALPTHAKNFMFINGTNIKVEGVIFTNSSSWTVPVRQSDNVIIDNVKIIGYRANTDGIDICNSRNVTVQNCFVRTNDDLIVVKSWEKQGAVEHVVVKNCVLWNQLAHVLSIGAELRENVNDVLFTNCDIIHDKGREWSLRIFQSDASLVSNVRFENLNIEEAHQFISLWTGKVVNSMDKALGRIEDVTFKNIKVYGAPLSIEIIGGSLEKGISNVNFANILLNNKKLLPGNIWSNEFVKNINVTP